MLAAARSPASKHMDGCMLVDRIYDMAESLSAALQCLHTGQQPEGSCTHLEEVVHHVGDTLIVDVVTGVFRTVPPVKRIALG